MDRRNFLRLLGLAPVAAVAAPKTYAFFGNILRPKAAWTEDFEWRFSYRNPIGCLTIVDIAKDHPHGMAAITELLEQRDRDIKEMMEDIPWAGEITITSQEISYT